jgi:hypothetical protein
MKGIPMKHSWGGQTDNTINDVPFPLDEVLYTIFGVIAPPEQPGHEKLPVPGVVTSRLGAPLGSVEPSYHDPWSRVNSGSGKERTEITHVRGPFRPDRSVSEQEKEV